jgi:hypothetical protein
MRRNAAAIRGDRPTVLISLRERLDAAPVVAWVRDRCTRCAVELGPSCRAAADRSPPCAPGAGCRWSAG